MNLRMVSIVVVSLAGVCLWAEETNAPPTHKSGVREYNSRVKMHSLPLEIGSPETRDQVQRPKGISDAGVLKTDVLPESITPDVARLGLPPTPRPPPKNKRSQNWLTPAMLANPTGNKESSPSERESSWGWLADEVLQTEKKKTESKEEEEEEEEDSSSSLDSPAGNLVLDRIADPRISAAVLNELGVKNVQDLARADFGNKSSAQPEPADQFPAAGRARISALEEESLLPRSGGRPEAEVPRDWLGREKENPSLLPRTEALFSRRQESEFSWRTDSRTAAQASPSLFRPDSPSSVDAGYVSKVFQPPADAPARSLAPPLPTAAWNSPPIKPPAQPGALFGSSVAPPTFGTPATIFQPSPGIEPGRVAPPTRAWSTPATPSATWLPMGGGVQWPSSTATENPLRQKP